MMKASVDRELCTGCGLCESECPEVFAMDSEGIAVAKDGDVPPETEDACRTAAADCPVEAIRVTE